MEYISSPKNELLQKNPCLLPHPLAPHFALHVATFVGDGIHHEAITGDWINRPFSLGLSDSRNVS